MKKIFTRSFLFTAGVLLALELIVRLFFAENMSGRFDYGYHPTSGFIEQKNGSVDLVRAGGRRFRPQSFPFKKPEDTFRAFVLGDSVPRGPSLEEAYAWQLQELLKSQGKKAEILNLGIAGNGVRRSRIILDHILQYKPDAVIIHLNYSNEFEDEREWRRAQDFKSWHPAHWLIKSQVIARLYELKTEKVFWFWLPQKVRDQAGVRDADAEVMAEQDKGQMDVWLQLVRKQTLSNLEMLREIHCPVVIVIQCGYEKGLPLDDHGLTDFIREQNPKVPYVSMKETFEALEPADYFSDGAHLKKAGHRVLAEKIAEQLRQIPGWKEH